MADRSNMPRGSKGTPAFGITRLNDREISMCTGLLHRAVCHGQTGQIMEVIKKSQIAKQYHVPMASFLHEASQSALSYDQDESPPGAMGDASKRRRDQDEWEIATSVTSSPVRPTYAGGYDPAVPMPSGSAVSPQYGPTSESVKYANPKIPLPPGFTLEQWGQVMCSMPKVKALNMCYRELVQLAEQDDEIAQYLHWCKTSHGTRGSGVLKGNLTPSSDLAMYLEATGWESSFPTKSGGFKRELKK